MYLTTPRHRLHRAPDEKPGGASTADAAGAAADTPAAEPAEQPTFTQADLDRILADRLARQEKKLRREFEQTAEQRTEEELAAAAEWQTLAEKRQRQIQKLEDEKAALEQQAETAVKYGKALQTYTQKLSNGLPAPILALLDGKDEAARLEWLTANAAQFVSQTPQTPQPEGGPPPTPAPDNGREVSDEQRRSQAYFPRL